jgi:hypothetical protein
MTTKRKPDRDAWRRGIHEAATPRTGAKAGDRIALGTYVPREVHLRLKALTVDLERARGERVTLSDVVTEALEAFLKAHRPR